MPPIDIYPEHEAERILSGLGLTEADFSRPIENLSGGYRMRVALAHLLLSNPDVLMLDEPTNHLDKPTQRWFERFLLESNPTLLISHDTKFLMASRRISGNSGSDPSGISWELYEVPGAPKGP